MRIPTAFVLMVVTAFPAPAAPVPPPSEAEESVIRRLIEAMKDADLDVRLNVAYALSKIGPPAIESLVTTLKDTNTDRRAGAAYTLGLIGPQARSALPALLDALTDPEVEVRRQASYAIGRVLPTRVPSADVKRVARTEPSPPGAKP